MRKALRKIISVVLAVCLMMGLVVTTNAASTAKVSSVRAMAAGANFKFNYTSSDGVKHTHDTSTVNMRLVGTDQIVSTTGAGNFIINQGSNLKIGYCLEPNKTANNGTYDVDFTASEWNALSDAQRNYVFMVLAYGFPNMVYDDKEYTSASDAYAIAGRRSAATQTLIWEIISG